jgi:2-dehydropantoate 2-reductase
MAKAKSVDLVSDFVARRSAFGATIPPDAKASMLLDLEHGRRLELDWMSRAVARFGDELGVPTPVHHVFYAALKLWSDGTCLPRDLGSGDV